MINILAPETSSIGTVARKRRRQILQSQRTKATTNEDLTPPLKKKCAALITSSAPRKQSKDRETAAATVTNSTMSSPRESTSPKGKKPQMRYDPEVPMSKEEAAAWRKEQRRKRNRESAAASRQRQRDRISELEEEVNQWKSKYEEALARIEKLEQTRESDAIDCNADPIRSTAISSLESTAVSPCSSPRHNPISQQFPMSNSSCGVVSLQEQNHFEEMESRIACQGIQEQDENVKHLSEKISRPE
jgi:hypothetical protein